MSEIKKKILSKRSKVRLNKIELDIRELERKAREIHLTHIT